MVSPSTRPFTYIVFLFAGDGVAADLSVLNGR